MKMQALYQALYLCNLVLPTWNEWFPCGTSFLKGFNALRYSNGKSFTPTSYSDNVNNLSRN